MDIIRKLYTAKVKKLDDATYEAIITTGAVDRDGQIVKPEGIDITNYMRNPVVMYAHDYSALPVAKTLRIRPEGDTLVAQFQFMPKGIYELADAVHGAWDSGFLNATSIGFIPKHAVDADGNEIENASYHAAQITLDQTELLEFSIVPVPANQEALRRALDVGMMKDEQPAVEPREPAEKEGRVISGKDHAMLTGIVTDLNKAVKNLSTYLEANAPAKAIEAVIDPDAANTSVSIRPEQLALLREFANQLKEE